jgi:hypothetical protein
MKHKPTHHWVDEDAHTVDLVIGGLASALIISGLIILLLIK